MSRIRVHTHAGQVLDLTPDPRAPLARVLFLAGFWAGVPLCAGLGRCGLCRVRFLSEPPGAGDQETRRLGAQAVAQGWRLSCLHPALACEVELPEPTRALAPTISLGGPATNAETQPADIQATPDQDAPHRDDRVHGLDLAIDLGTTSLAWSVLDRGRSLGQGGELNPQIGLGAEVVSRLALAADPDGLGLLQGVLLNRLRVLIQNLSQRLGQPITRMGLAGNTAMILILLGKDAPGLRAAPYTLDYAGGEDLELAGDLPPVRIPPLLAPFVGGDLSAGLTALHFSADKPAYPFLLADLGTNGEFVLALSEQEYLLASVPLGPALEGVGLSCGRTAGPGAAVGFTLTPQGVAPRWYGGSPGDNPGLSGTGALSLTALLLRSGVIGPEGTFTASPAPLAQRLAAMVVRENGETRFQAAPGLYLSAGDLEELLKVKAAFHLALDRLLARAGLAPRDLSSVCLAGALGEHAQVADLETLGFLPPGLGSRVRKAGNTSLAGMALLLGDPQAWAWALTLHSRTRVLDLALDPSFQSDYLARMRFAHD